MPSFSRVHYLALGLGLVILANIGLGLLLYRRHFAEDGRGWLSDQPLPVVTVPEDTAIQAQPMVEKLHQVRSQKIPVGAGPKSLLFDASHQFLYVLNLEGSSVYEIERATRKINRKLFFDKTPAKGFDYETHKAIQSHEEKPVEGCWSHDGRYLWISLHNAGGVTVWPVREDMGKFFTKKIKKARLVAGKDMQKVELPFIPTGKTPKVILATGDSRLLFVANWHDGTVSALNITNPAPGSWYKKMDIPVGGTPRGMAMGSDGHLYVAQMASNTLAVIDTASLKIIRRLEVGQTPRHVLADANALWVSLSSPELLIRQRIDSADLRQQAKTADDPRTIALAPDRQTIWVACYAANAVQAFRTQDLHALGTWPVKGSPVGIAVWQQDREIEVWTANYKAGTLGMSEYKMFYEGEKRSLEEQVMGTESPKKPKKK